MGLKPEQFNLFLRSDFVSSAIQCQPNLQEMRKVRLSKNRIGDVDFFSGKKLDSCEKRNSRSSETKTAGKNFICNL
ncbi:hypothetical protein A0128_13995 [Leptospira tipperaryensis]|uniref:Uncharacterized protein n=1 Tax=Leptospira tipperaryensis TaxID=2564040 RepID=A0A1D7UZ41_9LEPT|nr:hypothetical protein A0128_13995 [Leptospira tipperaryensis]